jgi:hypothetical protein
MLNLDEFRAKRDYFQWLRRIQVLPMLNERKSALKRDIDVLTRKRNAASKRDKELIESQMLPLQWEYQEVWGEVAIIESEHEALTARVPASWQAAVFTITQTEDETARKIA